ncbi:MAG: hypothetical protein HQL07_02865 [Nitrospirae bacterium]|nr:hypothetical protein [Magnetococcales bacterium]HAT50392.1 hypothetical protein [Alphaproteobacteria bacterium]
MREHELESLVAALEESQAQLRCVSAQRDDLQRQIDQCTRTLAYSNRDLQQFAYAASHDLQEPLRLISGYVQLLEKKYRGALDDKADLYIHYITDGARHMQAMVHGLLEFSRVGSRGGAFVPTDCEAVLNRSLLSLKSAVNESGACITHDPLPEVSADGAQLVQVFQNLIGNAIKFRGANPPKVHISACRDEENWFFSFQDNGIGIETKAAERVFIIFQKLHSRTQYPGTGIGLALCKRIVEHHGGRIWVEPLQEQGSLIRFTLPVVS